MARTYTVSGGPTAVTVAVDLAEIAPAANRPCRITQFKIGQTTELGDAAEEQLQVLLVRGNATGGSGGSAATPRPLDQNDAAAGFAAEIFNTTQASAGSPVQMEAWPFNVRVGETFVVPEAMRSRAQNAEFLCLRLGAAPADSVSIMFTVWVEEL